MVTYNVSALPYPMLANGSTNTTTTLVAFFQLVNWITDFWLGLAFLLGVWFVFFVSTNAEPVNKASVASAFTLLASVFLYILGLVAGWTIIFSTILTLGCFYLLYRD